MTGFSDYSAQKILNHYVGKTAIGALPSVYIALFTAVGTDAGTGFTEVTGGSYARALTAGSDWNAAGASAPSTISNVNNVAFTTATAGWGTVIAFGAYDALTTGNLLWWDYLGNFSWLPCSVSSASPGVITAPAHGYSNGDPVIFSTEYGGAAPSFSASNFTGTLIVANATTDTFTVTNASTAVNTSSTGSGSIRKIVQQVINTNVVASFSGGSPGALVLSAA